MKNKNVYLVKINKKINIYDGKSHTTNDIIKLLYNIEKSMTPTYIYIYNLNDFKKYILYQLYKAGYTYTINFNLKNKEYRGYIDSNNNLYFLVLRFKNIYIKIINLNMIFKKNTLYKIPVNKTYKNLQNIIKKYGTKNTIGSYAINNFFNYYIKKYSLKTKNKVFKKTKETTNKILYYSLMGGLNLLNPLKKNQIIKNVNIYDVNSMYPYILLTHKLPYSTPKKYYGEYIQDEKYPLYIQHIKVDFKEKKIPFLNFSKNYNLNILENIKSSHGMLIDLYLNSIDLNVFIEQYTINEIYYIDGIKFKATNKIFADYIKKLYRLKQKNNDNDMMKTFYKGLMNTLYGKMGQKKEIYKKHIEIKEKKVIFKKLDKIETDANYPAITSFVSAYARQIMITEIEKNKDSFIYCDTDSIHLENKEIKTSKKIGAFKEEISGATAKYLGLKQYMYQKGKIKKIVNAGASEEITRQIKSFKNYKKGTEILYKKKYYDEEKKETIKKLKYKI